MACINKGNNIDQRKHKHLTEKKHCSSRSFNKFKKKRTLGFEFEGPLKTKAPLTRWRRSSSCLRLSSSCLRRSSSCLRLSSSCLRLSSSCRRRSASCRRRSSSSSCRRLRSAASSSRAAESSSAAASGAASCARETKKHVTSLPPNGGHVGSVSHA